MAATWPEPTTFPLMREMGLFFLQFKPKLPDRTYYGRLGEAIAARGKTDEILLSTINYDVLIEDSLNQQRAAVYYCYPPPDAPEGFERTVSLFKLHGSCNFFVAGAGARGVAFSGGVLVDGFGVYCAPQVEAEALLQTADALPPVMCYYMNPKLVQVASGWLNDHQQEWQSHVASAEKVAIVGVRPNVADEHLWNALASTEAELLYVGNAEQFQEWSSDVRNGRPSRVIGHRFGDSVDALIEEMLSD